MAEANVVNAFFAFFATEGCLQTSYPTEPSCKAWGSAAIPRVEEDRLKEHSAKLNIYKPMGLAEMSPETPKLLSDVTVQMFYTSFGKLW